MELTSDQRYRLKNRDLINERKRTRHAANREEINAKRRGPYVGNATAAAHDPKYEITGMELKVPSFAVQDPVFNQRIQMMKQNGVSWRATTFKNHINTAVANESLEVLQLAD